MTHHDQPLSCAIIDDESSGREILTKLIEQFVPQIGRIQTAYSIESGVKLIKEIQPDIVFLDIEMQDGSGFHLLEKWQERKFEVIFVTAWPQYAIQAVKKEALDYLVKPVNIEELMEAVQKASLKIKAKQQPEKQVEQFVKEMKSLKKQERLALHTINGLEMVKILDIVFCKSEENYTRFHFKNGKTIMVSKTLKHFEENLEQNGFFRIHKSHIVNLDEVQRYMHSNGGEVQMSDSTILEVSRTKKQQLMDLLSSENQSEMPD